MTNEHRPDVFTINDVMYYFADDIKTYFPKIFSFTGSDGLYGIINDGEIKRTEYIHAYFTNGRWSVSLVEHHYSKVMVSKEWTENIIQKNNIVVSKYFTMNVEPKEIILHNDEKLIDTNGSVLEIRTVGEINREHIYFNMDDVINCNNEMLMYYNSITYYKTDKRTRLFYRRIKPNEPLKLSYYFTYHGILAFMSKGCVFPLLKRLNDWINSVLLIEDTDVNSLLFKKTCESLKSTSAVYLLKLGCVKNLRHKFEISNDVHDDSIVFEHGKTYDLRSEFICHYDYYKRFWHCDTKMIKYDEFNQYSSFNSEYLLKNIFRKQGVTINCEEVRLGNAEVLLGNAELIVVSSTQLIKIYNEINIDLSVLYTSIEELMACCKNPHIDVIETISSYEEKQKLEQEQQKQKLEQEQEQEINRKIKRDKKIDRRRERARKREEVDEVEEEEVDEVEEVEEFGVCTEKVEEEPVEEYIIQKTIVENETEDISVFKCIIDWFEISFTSFCW